MRGLSFLVLLAASLTQAAPSHPWPSSQVKSRESTKNSGRLIFCHFMIGVVGGVRNSPDEYDADMQLAKKFGIDAFALNVGIDSYTDQALQHAYESAANNDMGVFISFDFNWYGTDDKNATLIGQMIAKFASATFGPSKVSPQLMVDGKAFASSFAGDAVNVDTIRTAASTAGWTDGIYFAPNFTPTTGKEKVASATTTRAEDAIDGALNWIAWPNNGDNKAPTSTVNVTVKAGDVSYSEWLGGTHDYVAPISPWFSTHFGAEVPYSKNWVFPADLLWYSRWTELLSLSPRFIEIITWNDYGESHYIGPLGSTHGDDGSSIWINDMPHDAWLVMAEPFIAAYKAGHQTVDSHIVEDKLFYWYRPAPQSVECDITDNTMRPGQKPNNASGNFFAGKPNGYQGMQDAVFVVTMLKEAARVSVTSGNNAPVSFDAPAGAFAMQVPMAVGKQSFSASRGDSVILEGTSLRDVIDECPCGIYNFNAYVGMLPPMEFSSLAGHSFANWLANSSCEPTASLGSLVPGMAAPQTAKMTASAAAAMTASRVNAFSPTVAPTAALGSISALPSVPHPPSTSRPTSSTFTAAPVSVCANAPNNAPPTAAGCNAGTVLDGLTGNLRGLCSFACAQGYCPDHLCACTSLGEFTVQTPNASTIGLPLDGDIMYSDLCAFSCPREYCPPAACISTSA